MNDLQAIRTAMADGTRSADEMAQLLGWDIRKVHWTITKLVSRGDVVPLPKRYALTSIGDSRTRKVSMRDGMTEEQKAALRKERERQYYANRKAKVAASKSEAQAKAKRAALAEEKRRAKQEAKQAAEEAEAAELAAKQSTVRVFAPVANDTTVSQALANRHPLAMAWGVPCNA